jgi:hypothetical protein
MTTIAQQGHLYRWRGVDVIALETGSLVDVREIDPDAPLWIGRKEEAIADALTPLPMKYFHGQIPAEPNTDTTP